MKTRNFLMVAVALQLGFDIWIGVEEWKRTHVADVDHSITGAVDARKPQIQFGSVVSTDGSSDRSDDEKPQLQFGSDIPSQDTSGRFPSNDPAERHQ